MTATHFKDALSCVRLWIHECERVYGDRLVSETDLAKFVDLRMSITMKFFGNLNQVPWLANKIRTSHRVQWCQYETLAKQKVIYSSSPN